MWAGPFCTLQLAHLGAEVIRVESADAHLRHAPAAAVRRRSSPAPNRSGYFNQYNQGKLSLALDLKQPEAIEVAKRPGRRRATSSCENFAAGVMDRMGLGYEVLRALRPDLIMIALSGYGATGPEHDKFVSYGPAQVPLSGMSSLTGYRRLAADARRHLVRRSRPAACTAPSRCSPRCCTARAPARASTSISRSGRRAIAVLAEGDRSSRR